MKSHCMICLAMSNSLSEAGSSCSMLADQQIPTLVIISHASHLKSVPQWKLQMMLCYASNFKHWPPHRMLRCYVTA